MTKNNYNYHLDMESHNSLSAIVKRIDHGSTVLEFGSANGRMTKFIKEELDCKVYAVELDEDAARDSEKYTEKMLVDDIEKLSWLDYFSLIRFDHIVFADVLEHLYDPLRVLSKATVLLKDSGNILVSIPNITHNGVVIELLKGEFVYRNAGLLDSTHIRFFSKKSFETLIDKSGLKKTFECDIYVPPELTELGCRYEDVPECVADFLESRELGEAYQFVFELQKIHANEEILPACINKHSRTRYAQLFIDNGDGFGEKFKTLFLEKSHGLLELEFDIGEYQNILRLRFDPLNRCLIIKLHEIVLIYKNGQKVALQQKISNAKFKLKGTDYFSTFDPIYHLCLENIDTTLAQTIFIRAEYQECKTTDILERIIKIQNEEIDIYKAKDIM